MSVGVSFSVPGRASQDVSVFLRLNALAQGSTTVLCDTGTALRCKMLFLRSTSPYSSMWSAISVSSTNEHSPIPLTTEAALSGLGTQCGVVRCMWNAVLGRNIITVGVKRLHCAEVLFQPGYKSDIKCEVYIRKELFAMSFCQVARLCSK